MDTVNWRFNSNSDEAIEFRRFHYQLAATIKNVLVVGYHLKGFLFDGHFPHYISLDWVSLNCWDIMRYQPRSHWYLEQEISFVRHFALPGCLTRVCLESWHTSGMWDFLQIRWNKMSTWNGIFNLDSLNTFYSWQPASPQQSLFTMTWLLNYVLPESRKIYPSSNPAEWSWEELLCKCL